MKKSDLFQISDLMDQKFDEKLKNIATRDDLNQFATKDYLKRELEESEERIVLSVNSGINNSFKEFEEKMDSRFNKIDEELLKRPTRDEIFKKWDDKIEAVICDVDSLKYMHKDKWHDLPSRSKIKSALIKENIT